MPVHLTRTHDAAVARLVIDAPPGNVIDAEVIAGFRNHLATLRDDPALKLIVISGQGKHFSFGASVPEHLPGAVDQMLPAFHDLFRDLEATGVPTAAVVTRQCLGGGAELASWCGMVFCDPATRIGCPEIHLAVFPPIAALSWRWRLGGARATRLVLEGAVVDGQRAVDLGLADVLDANPEQAMEAWFDANLAPRSPVAIRHAWRACRAPLARSLDEELPALERQYLDELMAHPDPVEGLGAFLEKRAPVWRAL